MKSRKYFGCFAPGFITLAFCFIVFQSCSTFSYKTYVEQNDVDDPEPNYNLTLNPYFQEYTSYMFIGNRVENFGTYFNTFFNATENYDEAYEDYEARVLSNYSERLDSIYSAPVLTQESKDKFNKAIEKASKVIQYHKSSAFMDQAVLLIGKSYYYLGDYLKAERKFSEFISKLSASSLIDEALLFHARTEMHLGNYEQALTILNDLIKKSNDKSIAAGSYQSLAEYYISIKDYDASLKNYRKSIELSNDNDFKAQMQFLIATVTARQNPGKGAREYLKVLDYGTSFELDYLSRYNYLKNLILSSNFTGVLKTLQQMKVDYKDNQQYLSDIDYLIARYYDQKNEYKNAIRYYKDVIINYPKTIASSDASYSIGVFYEDKLGDYLNAYRYYRFSKEESTAGHNARATALKLDIFKKYFDLRSVVAGEPINTEYDSLFLQELRPKQQENKQEEQQKQGKGDNGGFPGVSDSTEETLKDTSKNISVNSDSLLLRAEKVAKAKFELAELFIYDLSKPDSAERYLNESYQESEDRDFKSKVLYALADMYRNNNQMGKYDNLLKTIINEYPFSPVANECRRLLNLPPEYEEMVASPDDSIYTYAERMFANEKYSEALSAFRDISENYPSSLHLTRADYAIGWIYENILSVPDSAYFYYTKVAEGAPKSDYYNVVVSKIAAYQNSLGGNKDSIQTADTNKTETPENIQPQIEDKTGEQIDNTGETGEVPQNPDLIGNEKKKVENPSKDK
jgi:tetratricopeptide (TPR) repeat protein